MERRARAKQRKHEAAQVAFGMIAATMSIFAVIFLGAYAGVKKVVAAPSFAGGTVINGVDISGQTLAKGRQQIAAHDDAWLKSIQLPIRYNGVTITLHAKDLGLSTTSQQLLADAYARNKQGRITEDFDNSHQPFEGSAELLVDEIRLRQSVEKFLFENSVPAQDAKAQFDAAARTFSYTPEKDGVAADTQAVFEQVKRKLLTKDYSLLEVDGKFTLPTYANITEQMLRENTVLIGKCSTVASNNENRNVNIRLMCDAVNGLVLQPGETLSLNELVGKRTAEKGFRAAPSIIDGQLVDDLGGGICQLAGTLYNAALYADMEIIERVHHTWPSEYLPIGLDATLNWDNKDLKIKNRLQFPIYIAAELKDLTVRVEIYGQPPSHGMEIEIETSMLKEVEPPQPEVLYTNKLPVGESRIKSKGRKGYEVVAYRHYFMDGEIVMSEKISHDHFRALRGTVLVGTDRVIK